MSLLGKRCSGCQHEFIPQAPHQKYCDAMCQREARRIADNRRYRELNPVVQKRQFRDGKPVLGEALNEHEEEVLMWIAKGKSDGMIATLMGTTEETIRRLVADAKVRLGANSRGHMIALFLVREGHAKAF